MCVLTCYRKFKVLFVFSCFCVFLLFSIIGSHSTNKEASTVLCSVVKHTGSGRARKKCKEKHET